MFLGMTEFLRHCVPNHSTLAAPISDFLRDPRFRSKRSRRMKVPWGRIKRGSFGRCRSSWHHLPLLLYRTGRHLFSHTPTLARRGQGRS